MVAGTKPSRRARAVNRASTAPAAPSRWPVMDLVELIIRRRDPGCRRAYQISLTEAGRQKAEEVSRGFERLEEILAGNLTEEEIGSLTAGLGKIKASLEAEEEIQALIRR